ncbi:hypothetical protein lerEdw1_011129 [Lerista edwardsae]|nr:hypothetical protein lerEdw1_011129 [Lerista edwardsae]
MVTFLPDTSPFSEYTDTNGRVQAMAAPERDWRRAPRAPSHSAAASAGKGRTALSRLALAPPRVTRPRPPQRRPQRRRPQMLSSQELTQNSQWGGERRHLGRPSGDVASESPGIYFLSLLASAEDSHWGFWVRKEVVLARSSVGPEEKQRPGAPVRIWFGFRFYCKFSMGVQRRQESVLRFHGFLRQVCKEGTANISKGPFAFEADVQCLLLDGGCGNLLESFWNRSGVMFVVERARPCEETSYSEEQQMDGTCVSGGSPKEDSALLALPVSRARQLISFYTMSQHPNLTDLNISPTPLPPLWVRCDGSDPQQTVWLGAESLCTGSKLTGVTLHTIVCNGPVSYKNYSADLEELKATHRTRHRCSDLTTKGFARYKFLEATSFDSLCLEDSLIPLERNIFADFAWNTVTNILQTPPPTSAAVLKIQIASGSPLNSVYELSRELQFLVGLAKCLKSDTADWPKPLERKPAVELVQKFLRDLKDEVDGVKAPNGLDANTPEDDPAAVCGSVKTHFNRRGDLDVVEQLWCKIWRSFYSFVEIIHRESNNLLSRLIKQSYHGSAESVDLSGNTPVQMLLEMGVEKMWRDYVGYFLGEALATRTHLDYFTSPSVDLQEQVHRVQKLHHILEIVTNCVELLNLNRENLIFLTRSCISYYKENPLNEKHTFHLPVKPTLVMKFCQNAYPQMWRVEIGSGQGQKRVRTTWQLSTSPPATHLDLSSAEMAILHNPSVALLHPRQLSLQAPPPRPVTVSFGLAGPLDDGDACDSREETCFITRAECSRVSFD